MSEKELVQTKLAKVEKELEDMKSMNQAKSSSLLEKHLKLGNQLQQLISLHQEISVDLQNN